MKSAEERQLSIDAPAGAPAAVPANDSPPIVPAESAAVPKKRRRRRRRWQADMFAPPAPDPHPADPNRVKPRSLGIEPLTLAEEAFQYERQRLPVIHDLPVNRGDCADGPRPCPLIRCRYNNYGFVTPHGAYKLNFPNREPWEMPERESCALDVADDHDETDPRTLEETGRFLNLTWVRMHQIEDDAFQKLRRTPLGREIARALAKRRKPRGEI